MSRVVYDLTLRPEESWSYRLGPEYEAGLAALTNSEWVPYTLGGGRRIFPTVIGPVSPEEARLLLEEVHRILRPEEAMLVGWGLRYP